MEDPTQAPIQKVAVIGAGAAGRGVARVLAEAGIDVLLVERDSEILDRRMKALREGMNRDIARWSMTESERNATLARIRGMAGIPDLRGVPMVFDCATEDMKEKAELLRELDRRAPPGCLFLLNTSTLSISGLADAVSEARREDVLGLHFLHPVSRIPLVEMVRGRETTDRAVELARDLAKRLGKEVLEVAEYPGYVTSRLTLTLINEAIHLVMEGVTTRDALDRAMKLRLGSTHGPLGLADEIGLDSILRALEALWQGLGLTQYRPAPLLRRMVNEGWLGEKTGRGFYIYDEAGTRLNGNDGMARPSLEHLLEPDGALMGRNRSGTGGES